MFQNSLAPCRWTPLFLGILVSAFLVPVDHAYAQPNKEALIQEMPKNFKVGSKTSQPYMNMVEMVPSNETVDDWSEMVTTQIFFKLANTSPPDFLRNIGGRWMQACPGSSHGDINNGTANGYPVSMLLLICPKNPTTGKPETTLIRAIHGETTLYAVQYAFRNEPTQDLIAKAGRYLGSVIVCDSESSQHDCASQQ